MPEQFNKVWEKVKICKLNRGTSKPTFERLYYINNMKG